MSTLVVTPWRESSELFEVRRQLYQLGEAKDATGRRRGLHTVASWKVRGNLPFAVESTALLVEAVLNQDISRQTPLTVRALFSTAVCRFVTGFCDDNVRGRSLSAVAQSIGLPLRFVDLRNEATHGQMPSISVLQRAAHDALQWLWDAYWAKLDATAVHTDIMRDGTTRRGPATVTEMTRAEIRDDLRTGVKNYRDGRVASLKKKDESPEQETQTADMACIRCVRICRGQMDRLTVLVDVLLEERNLIPGDLSLNTPMHVAHHLWTPLLRRLATHQRHFLPLLCDRLALLLTQPSRLDPTLDPVRAALYSWLRHLFTAPTWTGPRARVASAPAAVWKPGLGCPSGEASKDGAGERRAEAGASQAADGTLRGVVVSTCIMNPGVWSWKLARELIEGGDVVFRHEWVPVYNGSLPTPEEVPVAPAAPAAAATATAAAARPFSVSDEGVSCPFPPLEVPSMNELRQAGALVLHDPSRADQQQDDQERSSPKTRGWKKWAGAWRPKPIGMVDV